MVLLLLVTPLVFYISNSKDEHQLNLIDQAVLALSAPVQWGVVQAIDLVSFTWTRYLGLVGVEAANARLRQENAELRAQLAASEELRHDNERLRLLVGLRERAPQVTMVFAEVVGMGPSPLFRSLRIDRGSKDGVGPGAAVVSHGGVVGRVVAAGGSWADVMLLVDGNSSLDVLVQRTRARARARGQGGDEGVSLDLQYLARLADIEPGDMLITSGLGHNFPKGLPVGQVTAVERRAFGLYQRATAQPTVDFGRLEAVMVIPPGFAADTDLESLPGPAAEPDLSPELLPPAAAAAAP